MKRGIEIACRCHTQCVKLLDYHILCVQLTNPVIYCIVEKSYFQIDFLFTVSARTDLGINNKKIF